MMEADPYGTLQNDAKSVAKLTQNHAKTVQKAFEELDKNRVWSRDANGVPYCRRLVRDNEKFLLSQEHGRQGGNPTLARTLKGTLNPGVNGGVNPTPHPPLNPHARNLEARSYISEKDSAYIEPRYRARARGERPLSATEAALAGLALASRRSRGDE
jgi:hypothetical protein